MLGELLALLFVFCFVSSNAIFRKVETRLSPSQINAFRTTIGAISFLLFTVVIGVFGQIFEIPFYIWLLLFVSIIAGQIFGDTTYFYSQALLGTTKAMAISMTFPLFTFLFTIIILNESIPIIFYIATLLILLGVALIAITKEKQVEEEFAEKDLYTSPPIDKVSVKNHIKQSSDKDPRKLVIIAISLGIISSISMAIGIVLTEYSLNLVSETLSSYENTSLIANAIRFPFAAAILVIMAYFKPTKRIKTWEKKTWTWLIVASLVGTTIGAYVYTEATRVAGAAFVSIIGAASPIFAIPISWFLNKEKITLLGILGVCLTITGVILVIIL